MKKSILVLLFIVPFFANAQKVIATKEQPNLIVITTDGFRWQEVFNGMDVDIANQSKFNKGDSALIFQKYNAVTVAERQKLLLPFFWNKISSEGQLYGNRNKGNKVDVANPHWFSYPGYNEIFTGFPDSAINSNDYMPNPHSNVLGFLNKQKGYEGKVAAFAAWNAYNRILNEKVSGIPVVNGFEGITKIMQDPTSKMLANILKDSFKPFKQDECLDVFTHYQAMHYLETKKPKVLYISYGETDEWAHAGMYGNYLDAAHQVDAWVKDIWDYVQATPGYKNNTYLLVTSDHGRGFEDKWTSHGADVPGASSIWFALLGPNLNKVNTLGEQTNNHQLYQKQFAATMAKLIGFNFTAEHEVGKPIY